MSDQQSFIVTARKWRPLRFADVVGQDHITTTLKNAIASNRLHHAFLFTGPRGVGKTTCARILARAVNCTSPIDHEPCNQCDACKDVLEGRSVDVIEIDGASNNSVDDVRKLRDNAKYAPLHGRYKMYIIDEVHMLSTAAFNALLKTLEEPPPHLIFVFATTEIHKVPATILSRCQRFDFRRMEIASIVGHLTTIAKAEGITIDEASLVAIAKKADGSMRDSQSIFDQAVSFCGTTITASSVADALHLIDADFYFELSDAVRDHDVKRMFELSRQVIARGYDLQECLIGLLEHYRNFLTVLTTGSTDLIDAAATTLQRYSDDAAQLTQADVLRIMTLITQGEAVLRQHPPQPRVRFEFTLAQLAAMDKTIELSDLLSRLSATPSSPVGGVAMAVKVGSSARAASSEQRVSSTLAVQPTSPLPRVTGLTAKIRESAQPVSALSVRNLADKWSQVLDELPERLAFVRSTSKQGLLVIELLEVGLVLRPSSEVIQRRLADLLTDLKQHLAAVYGAPVGVQLMPAQPHQSATQQDQNPDTQHRPASLDQPTPIEQALVELFKARKVSVN